MVQGDDHLSKSAIVHRTLRAVLSATLHSNKGQLAIGFLLRDSYFTVVRNSRSSIEELLLSRHQTTLLNPSGPPSDSFVFLSQVAWSLWEQHEQLGSFLGPRCPGRGARGTAVRNSPSGTSAPSSTSTLWSSPFCLSYVSSLLSAVTYEVLQSAKQIRDVVDEV